MSNIYTFTIRPTAENAEVKDGRQKRFNHEKDPSETKYLFYGAGTKIIGQTRIDLY